MKRKKYYVNMQMNDIQEQPIPGNIQYEILANERDINDIEMMFNQLDADAKHALSFIVNYVDEQPVDDDRKSYGDHLIKIYRKLYDLGTEETKQAIKQMNIFKYF